MLLKQSQLMPILETIRNVHAEYLNLIAHEEGLDLETLTMKVQIELEDKNSNLPIKEEPKKKTADK